MTNELFGNNSLENTLIVNKNDDKVEKYDKNKNKFDEKLDVDSGRDINI